MADPVVDRAYLDHVPLSWHRVPKVERDEKTGRLRATGVTDRYRGYPVGWLDETAEGTFALSGATEVNDA